MLTTAPNTAAVMGRGMFWIVSNVYDSLFSNIFKFIKKAPFLYDCIHFHIFTSSQIENLFFSCFKPCTRSLPRTIVYNENDETLSFATPFAKKTFFKPYVVARGASMWISVVSSRELYRIPPPTFPATDAIVVVSLQHYRASSG